MSDICKYCVKYDVCCYKEKRKELNEKFYPFQMRCSLYEKKKINIEAIETATILRDNTNSGGVWERIFSK